MLVEFGEVAYLIGAAVELHQADEGAEAGVVSKTERRRSAVAFDGVVGFLDEIVEEVATRYYAARIGVGAGTKVAVPIEVGGLPGVKQFLRGVEVFKILRINDTAFTFFLAYSASEKIELMNLSGLVSDCSNLA